MGGRVIFAVSTPCSRKGKPSGHRIVKFNEGRLTVIPQESGDVRADTEINVQAFCYLKPKNREVLSECIDSSILDSSDYMLLAKSNGFIEIIQDYQHKIENFLPLEPTFLMKCIPEDDPDFGFDCMIAGLEYREGLLYCCMCTGRIYIFVLNLPYDYIQAQNTSIASQKPDLYRCNSFCGTTHSGREAQSMEEATFFLNMKFTGRSKLKHICYYLLPMESEQSRTSPSIYPFCNVYQNRIVYRPSMYVQLDEGVSKFRINPLDRFSFLTVSPRSPLMIRKIMLPMVYVDFFVTFVSLKKRIQQAKAEEILSWNKLAREIGYDSLVNWVVSEPLHEVDNLGSVAWEDLARCDGISVVRTITVWMQRQGHTKDDIYELFHRSDLVGSTSSSRSASNEPRPLSRRRRSSRFGLQRAGALREPVDLPCSTNWELDLFMRDVRRNTFTVDFEIVQSNFDSNRSEVSNQEQEEEGTRTSFLTDSYKNMDIICIDYYLSLSVFRPKYFDEALIKIESFHSEMREDLVGSTREDTIMRRSLSNLSSFKKLFMLTDSLCMVLDTCGVVLLNRRHLLNTKNLVHNEPHAIRVASFKIGLISDAIVIVDTLHECHDCGAINVAYKLLITCIPDEILAFNGKFFAHSKIGDLVLCDRLKLNRKQKFVDKLCLLDYETFSENRKRPHSMSEEGHSGTKRTKWE
ncbi:YDL176W [Zygosaccharomyces parabailii]|uniref:ZYBA0S04-02322g1_1 n=1 Tax=Zygosaccharomyces bailii (strain CLIB 213 / ATCC 58445 / CBS 680 / BCRC 21525 / NBRC 1098 / NCYC 1416 / NRRL Y-2227) TaxID=1333698 RepID=A0A8J2WZC9_ZYGB2|nr:YDL176W [Zygosaccharomyces parabailii]AQZ14522.1 YDL176W [Zygosaccharomyces parabailii]CDF89356.1 ZYBA0S04-02322g1_1 [Zygosaccharomyces bailii CLIB 213]